MVKVASYGGMGIVLCWLELRLCIHGSVNRCGHHNMEDMTYENGVQCAIEGNICGGEIIADEVSAGH